MLELVDCTHYNSDLYLFRPSTYVSEHFIASALTLISWPRMYLLNITFVYFLHSHMYFVGFIM